MTLDMSEVGGAYRIFVDRDTLSVYVSWTLSNDVIRIDDESQYTFNVPFVDTLIHQETVYNPHQYTGRQYDAESGLYHYRARAYSADIGRFMQQDPAGMVDGANMYVYVGNNPVNGVDPSGMKLTYAACMELAYEAYSYKLKGWTGLWNALFISCLWCVRALYFFEKVDCGLGWNAHGCISAARVRYHSNVIDCQRKSGKFVMSGVYII